MLGVLKRSDQDLFHSVQQKNSRCNIKEDMMKKYPQKCIEKSMKMLFCHFSLLKLKSRNHFEKVPLEKILISVFPSPHQLCLSKNENTKNECVFTPGPIGPYTEEELFKGSHQQRKIN